MILPNVLEPDVVSKLARRFDEIVASEGNRGGLEVHQEPGTARLA